ncbi:type II toxin-antitoxin system death-on-curing family toxin [Burkholderia ambifaria]|uniref:type II toxin-antitoxin system death-on-curing family toxin n=1 Tax=Burkholderia ambifaria TaxID=152480 RepID=UPI000CFEDE13|nr:type II toxin-antitoxin system death-on-curing family toxin [Burkholderia ambifaria]MBR8182304.1 type II toxin-antitoxin system death-on-curing family toxin [Burkholderia ambifaria]PRF96849.1 type II toxin-antitoxin system death-on-curing family toxin [Burkholderia ambifaria]QQJ95624.1 type II toxin-antitoxin system death-on-curing family toxin [Burkholderia ambifaria]UEP33271.1 type II toxin-antitoxin system death-on-curing family toxin [Burkholderia ambifaria]
MLDLDYVITIHDEIIRDLGGLSGFAHAGRGGVEAALHRVENHVHYAGLDDVFGIAATYAVAIARGHVFNDANKRTGLTCALTYMERQGISIPRLADLEDLMVDVADGGVTSEELAEYFSAVWEMSRSD